MFFLLGEVALVSPTNVAVYTTFFVGEKYAASAKSVLF